MSLDTLRAPITQQPVKVQGPTVREPSWLLLAVGSRSEVKQGVLSLPVTIDCCSSAPADDIMEAVGFKSGSSTPQRSGSTAGLHRPRLSIDSASPAIDPPQLSSSLPGSLSGSSPLLTPRQGSHTMDFFEMCASLITTLAR